MSENIYMLNDQERENFNEHYGDRQQELFDQHKMLGYLLSNLSGIVQNPCFKPKTFKEINEYRATINSLKLNLDRLMDEVEFFVMNIDNEKIKVEK